MARPLQLSDGRILKYFAVACHHGWQTNRIWHNDVLRDEGGFIAFLDGHVEWFESIASKLYKLDGTTTMDLAEAATYNGIVPNPVVLHRKF